MRLIPTPSQTVGPFFHLGCTQTHAVSCMASGQAKGQRVGLTCRVLDADGAPMPDAMIEIWQADAEGRYHHPEDPRAKDADLSCTGFGRLGTAADGACVFETIKPGPVPGNDGTMQAPHLNISLFARGMLQRFTTRIYFAGDPRNLEDPVLALVPEDRRITLMAQPCATTDDWSFAIHLGGEQETVFFDI